MTKILFIGKAVKVLKDLKIGKCSYFFKMLFGVRLEVILRSIFNGSQNLSYI